MLLQRIQAASLEARKAKQTDRAATLVTLFAEAQRVGKDAGNRESTDEEVVKVVRKFLKGIDEFIVATKDNAQRLEQLHAERALLEEFLPKQADEATLKTAIGTILAGLTDKSPKAMGQVMSALRTQFAGNYDGTVASRLVKEAIAAG